MGNLNEFVALVKSEFPDNRLTYQKGIPTFHPQSADEAAAVFRLANGHGQRIYISGFGNNVTPVGSPFSEVIVVVTDKLNELLEVSAKDLFVRVQAGYPLREINYALRPSKLMLPHASLPYAGSAGGAVAVGLSAELHEHHFPLRRYVLQLEVVTPEGDIVTPGSICFKSVSGYDVAKIFVGSWGLLGLIVSAAFRVMPDSAEEEFASQSMKAVSRQGLLAGLVDTNREPDAEYSRKLKRKLDPQGILPVL